MTAKKKDNPTAQPLRIVVSGVTAPLTEEQARAWLGESALQTGEKRLEVVTSGPWSIVTRVCGLAVSAEWNRDPVTNHVHAYTLHGQRTLRDAKPSGYEMEGRVSIGRQDFRAFTSSVMFELPGGKLINCAVLHVCMDQPKGRARK